MAPDTRLKPGADERRDASALSHSGRRLTAFCHRLNLVLTFSGNLDRLIVGYEKRMIIPLDTAHKILATFGITKPSREYERWVKDSGFDVDDFPSVLNESEYIFVLDWRACLTDELERIATALGKLGITVFVDPLENGQTASVTINERLVELSYSPNDAQTSWLTVINAIQSIVPSNIEFRESVNNGDSDTDVYSVLPEDEWHDLDVNATEAIQSLFRPLGPVGG